MEAELPAYQRLRTTLVLIDVYLIISGILDVVIGVIMASNMPNKNTEFYDKTFPVIWLLGLPLMLSGMFGLFSIYKGTQIWTVTWVVTSIIANGAVFMYVGINHQMEPDLFGVNMNVYGKCNDHSHKLCLCKLPHQGALGVLYTSCDSVWRRTTLFLLLVSIFTIGLTILIIALFLALTVSFWLPRCAKKNVVDMSTYSMYTSCYAAETTCLNDVTTTAMETIVTTSSQPLLQNPNSPIQQT